MLATNSLISTANTPLRGGYRVGEMECYTPLHGGYRVGEMERNDDTTNINLHITPTGYIILQKLDKEYISTSNKSNVVDEVDDFDSDDENENKINQVTSYPACHGVFIHVNGKWNWFSPYEDETLCMELEFKCENPNASFKKFAIYGYLNGYVQLYVSLNELYLNSTCKYLQYTGAVKASDATILLDSCFHYWDSKSQFKEMQNAWEIIKSNNTVPDKWLPIIDKVMQMGRCF